MSGSNAPTIRPSALTLGAFALFVLLAGGASVAIRFTYTEIPTFWGAAARFLLGALILWGLVALRRVPLPRGRALLGAALFGALSVGGAFIFIYWGLERTPASIYQVITAVVPLMTLAFAFGHGLERLSTRAVVGAVLAVIGIVVTVSGSLGGALSLPRVIAILLGAACFAEAGVVAKIFPRSHPLAMNAVAMTVGSAMLLLASLLAGESWLLPSTTGMWLAFAYLVLGASVGAFLLYVYVLNRWTASGASYGFVLIPLVTAVLATTLAGEQIGALFVLGAALVLGGVWVGALMGSGGRAEKGAARMKQAGVEG